MRWAAVLFLLGACRPDLGAPQSLVDGPRLLAVVAEPPEAAPGEAVSLRALVVGAAGTVDAQVVFSLCLDPKPVAENNVVADSCIFDPAAPVGSGQDIAATLPQDACARFGPDTPPTIPGEPPLRPRDADITGGYYQPLRAAYGVPDGEVLAGVGLVRLTCNLPNAPLATIQEYRMRYHRNQNPTIGAVAIVDDAGNGLPTSSPVAPGQRIHLAVAWPAEAAEIFPVFDLRTHELVDVRESLRASWFATAGDLDADRTGRASDDLTLTASNDWTAPQTPGPVHFWIVLRDSRGGATATAFDIDVR